ncbi:cytochrome C biosynthesis protein [uncultured Parabacteroides sp.]|uniref:cytochrome C biosynthesis protein n=1 Tax=uncultured Parabacteroides sp. TaxID=512312 RepID=UPI0025D258BA|nr:cytochrome C biosynthesis protein [uncultured Parabacteroides sp.]
MTYKYVIYLLLLIISGSCTLPDIEPEVQTDIPVTLFPDYTGVTFPSNIAPPNFRIIEEGDEYYTEIGNKERGYITIRSKQSSVIIPVEKWRELLKHTAGNTFYIRISIHRNGKWIQHPDITNVISRSPIDPYLVYRLLYPGYELWNQMGIYQRDLTSYDETPVIENQSVENGCLNCHTFCKNSPETMMIHIRGKAGGTLVRRQETINKTEVKAPGMNNSGTYASWHPGGRYLAFSVNEIQQYFHSTGPKAVEVSDSESDLVILDTETNSLITDTAVYGEKWMETFPTWNPDGDMLYYCRSKAINKKTPLDSIHYDLYRIPFHEKEESFGTPECIFNASEAGKSVSFPRISPDGKFLMFTCSDYGNFSIWHPESELYLLDLATNNIRNMEEVNSNDVESFHSWSSTGEWFVFSSKRLDGLWAHPYIASFDSRTGMAGKPFVLPQEDPDFYLDFTRTFNLPELITKPVENRDELVGGYRNNYYLRPQLTTNINFNNS